MFAWCLFVANIKPTTMSISYYKHIYTLIEYMHVYIVSIYTYTLYTYIKIQIHTYKADIIGLSKGFFEFLFIWK